MDITHDNVCSSMLSCFYSHLLSTVRPISSFKFYRYKVQLEFLPVESLTGPSTKIILAESLIGLSTGRKSNLGVRVSVRVLMSCSTAGSCWDEPIATCESRTH